VGREYKRYYFCRNCQKHILKSLVLIGKNNKLLCPYCHMMLRLKARDKKHTKYLS